MVYGAGGVLILAAILLVAVFLLVLPLRLAAVAMSAKRSGTGWCLLSLAGASFMQMVGLSLPGYGTAVALLLSSVAFAAILGTDFLRGIGIAILHVLFSVLLAFLATLIFGLSFGPLLCL